MAFGRGGNASLLCAVEELWESQYVLLQLKFVGKDRDAQEQQKLTQYWASTLRQLNRCGKPGPELAHMMTRNVIAFLERGANVVLDATLGFTVEEVIERLASNVSIVSEQDAKDLREAFKAAKKRAGNPVDPSRGSWRDQFGRLGLRRN